MHFDFMSRCWTTGTIFIVRQRQEKFLGKNKKLCLAFNDLEKAFIRVPYRVLWQAMQILGAPEWFIAIVQGMYWMQSVELG